MKSSIALNILVVDQDPLDRSLVRHLAESFEWTVSEATSVREMTAWLHSRPANDLACVLVAYPLPDGDAFDALAASKAIRADFPVVLLAEKKDADVVLRILDSGAAAYVEKTALSESRLGQAVRRAMHSKGEDAFGVIQKACHDLRNPLSAMMINANILSRDGVLPNERRMKLATRILSSAARMNRMLADLFDYSAAAQGKELSLRTREADLNLIASETLAEVRAEYPVRAVVLETNGDLRGRWDPSRIGQMLHNMVAIALNRGAPRASLLINCNECNEPPSPPSVEIRIAIKHDLNVDLTHLKGTAPADGLEPSLDVAKRIVEAHHGTFEVPSSDGDSTTFLVRLPKTSGATIEPAS
jgi:signal transduction histidine kinase